MSTYVQVSNARLSRKDQSKTVVSTLESGPKGPTRGQQKRVFSRDFSSFKIESPTLNADGSYAYGVVRRKK